MRNHLGVAALGIMLACAVCAPGQNVAAPPAAQPMIFDVRNGDQEGKLLIKDAEVAFESLTDARHSRNWKYTDIREISRGRKELRIRPFRGDRYAFQFKNNEMRDRLYNLISQRVVEARQAKK